MVPSAFAERALAIYEKAVGPNNASSKDTARITADALDALGRTEEASALREKYGVTFEGPST